MKYLDYTGHPVQVGELADSQGHQICGCCGGRFVDNMKDFNDPYDATSADLQNYRFKYHLQKNRGVLVGFNLEGEIENVENSLATSVKIADNLTLFFRGRLFPKDGDASLTKFVNPVKGTFDTVYFRYGVNAADQVADYLKAAPEALHVFIATKDQHVSYDKDYIKRTDNEIPPSMEKCKDLIIYQSVFVRNYRYPSYSPKLALYILKGSK